MKLNKQMIFLIIFITIGLLLTLMAFESGYNLIENPSFEIDDDLDGTPDCWNLILSYPNDYYLDSWEKVFGEVSLKMETYCHPSSPEHIYTVGSGGACGWFDVKPNTTYTLSYYVKTDRPESVVALANTWEYDVEGKHLGQHYRYISLSPGWQRIVFTFTTYPDAVEMWLAVSVRAYYAQPVTGWKEGEFYTSWIDGVQLEESVTVSPFHTTFPSCPRILSATIDIDPDTLNLKSKGKFITCYIELPEDYYVEDIDRDSVALTEINDDLLDPPLYTVGPSEIGDYDEDGIPDLMVKFDREELIAVLGVGDEVEIKATGKLINGTLFKGSDTIKVIDKGKK